MEPLRTWPIDVTTSKWVHWCAAYCCGYFGEKMINVSWDLGMCFKMVFHVSAYERKFYIKTQKKINYWALLDMSELIMIITNVHWTVVILKYKAWLFPFSGLIRGAYFSYLLSFVSCLCFFPLSLISICLPACLDSKLLWSFLGEIWNLPPYLKGRERWKIVAPDQYLAGLISKEFTYEACLQWL